MGDLTVLGVSGASFAPGGAAGQSVLQIVDPDNTATVLFDLNDPTGANNGLAGSVGTAILSDIDMGSAKLDSNAPDVGRSLAFNRSSLADFKFKMKMQGSSYDNLNLAIGILSSYLADGCVMRWIPNGSAQTRLIDVLPSVTPVLLNGQQLGMFQATILLQTPEGVEMSLQRLGFIRRAKLDPALNLLANPTLLRDSNADGTPDSWTKNSTPTLTVDSATESLRVQTTSTGLGVFQTAVGGVTAGLTYTASIDAKVATGSTRLAIEWRNGGGGTISTSTGTTYTGTAFSRIQLTAAAPGTAVNALLLLYSVAATSDFYVRNAQCELASSATDFRVGVQTMNVDPTATAFAQFMPVFNPSDAPAPCEITVAFPDASSAIAEADFGLISDKGVVGSRALSDFLNGPNYARAAASGNGWTVTADSSVTIPNTDTNASGGSNALISHATAPTVQKKRITWTRTTLLDALRGRWKVYGRCYTAAPATDRVWGLQLLWGAGTIASEANDEVFIDTTYWGSTSSDYFYVDLGDIELPLERNVAIGQLTLQLWTRQTAGAAANLLFDHLVFAPTDDSAIVTSTSGDDMTVSGKDLTTPPKKLTADPTFIAGEVKGSAVRLNLQYEGAGWGGNTDGIFTGVANGNHTITYKVSAYIGSGGSCTVAYGVADITGDSVQVVGSKAYTKSGKDTFTTIRPDTNAHKYQPRVYLSARTNPAKVDVEILTLSSTVGITQNGKMRTDPGSMPSRAAVEQLDSSGNLGATLDATGTPFWLPPGLSLLWITVFDIPTVEIGGFNRSTLARTMTVTPTVYPRHWQ